MQIAEIICAAASGIASGADDWLRPFGRSLAGSSRPCARSVRRVALANRQANVRRMRGRPNAKQVRKARRAQYRSIAA